MEKVYPLNFFEGDTFLSVDTIVWMVVVAVEWYCTLLNMVVVVMVFERVAI